MDFSDVETSSSSSSSESESSSSSAEDVSKNGPAKRARFLSTYRRHQEWSLPESIIYYMAMNPKNAEVYEKLVQSCKYFFVKNPILVADSLYYDCVDGKWSHFVYRGRDRTKFSSVSSKFWITKEFSNYVRESNPKMVASILPKFYRVEVKELNINFQSMSLDDFLFLASNVEEVQFNNNTVMNADGSIVPFEKLLALLPNVYYIQFLNKPASSSITSKTAKELAEILQFSKVECFELCNLSEVFDIEFFLTYMKKSIGTKYILYFSHVSEDFKNRLEEMVDEIIESKICDIKLDFPGLDEEKHSKIVSLYFQSR